MPGMSGIELGQRIRQDYHDLPVVLTSGYSHVLAQNGTYGFELLHKPYSIEQLSRVLRKVATWQRRRRILDACYKVTAPSYHKMPKLYIFLGSRDKVMRIT